MKRKFCGKCREFKDIEEFHKCNNRTDGLQYRCKECSSNYDKLKRKLLNRPRQSKGEKLCPKCKRILDVSNFSSRPDSSTGLVSWCRLCTTLRKYGMIYEDYLRLLQDSDGECGICGQLRDFVIDHDHETGKVRGLLCAKCNTALGLFNDSIYILKHALSYLEYHTTIKNET